MSAIFVGFIFINRTVLKHAVVHTYNKVCHVCQQKHYVRAIYEIFFSKRMVGHIAVDAAKLPKIFCQHVGIQISRECLNACNLQISVRSKSIQSMFCRGCFAKMKFGKYICGFVFFSLFICKIHLFKLQFRCSNTAKITADVFSRFNAFGKIHYEHFFVGAWSGTWRLMTRNYQKS